MWLKPLLLCCWQDPILWDECSHRSRGGQGSDNTVGPGHEEDGAMCGQTARWGRQRERGHKARWSTARWEEVCMLEQQANQETTSQHSFVICPFYLSHSLHLLLFSMTRLWLHVSSSYLHFTRSQTNLKGQGSVTVFLKLSFTWKEPNLHSGPSIAIRWQVKQVNKKDSYSNHLLNSPKLSNETILLPSSGYLRYYNLNSVYTVKQEHHLKQIN